MRNSGRSRQYRRQQSSLDSVDEEESLVAEQDQDESPPRRLIDYTVTNRQRRVGEVAAAPLSEAHSPSHQKNKLVLPSFIYLEKISFGSILNGIEAPNDEERVDFFLKVKKRRTKGTIIQNYRLGLEKSRSQKSPLFGSFKESGEYRSSYTDLKEAWSKGEGVGKLTL